MALKDKTPPPYVSSSSGPCTGISELESLMTRGKDGTGFRLELVKSNFWLTCEVIDNPNLGEIDGPHRLTIPVPTEQVVKLAQTIQRISDWRAEISKKGA